MMGGWNSQTGELQTRVHMQYATCGNPKGLLPGYSSTYLLKFKFFLADTVNIFSLEHFMKDSMKLKKQVVRCFHWNRYCKKNILFHTFSWLQNVRGQLDQGQSN
jgi:hypothetical protein